MMLDHSTVVRGMCRCLAMREHGRYGLTRKLPKRLRFLRDIICLLIHSGRCYLSGPVYLYTMQCRVQDGGVCVCVCVCRCWCPDRTLAQARKYIADVMGTRYAEGVILDLEAMWAESTSRTPLICFLSMGSDPTNNIEGLAKKLHIDCHAISMGQGQEVHARRLVHQSMTSVS